MARGAWREVRGWLALALAVWTLGTLASRAGARARPPAGPPWQHSFRELDPPGQRTYRLLREGLLEAENARAREGAWPTPEALAAAGIPPFAPDGRREARREAWTLRREGPAVTYLGEGADTRWLVLFLEPDAAARAAPPPATDEEHHTLPDGTALHVTVWTQPTRAGPPPDGVLTFPATSGWTQRIGQ